MRSDLTSDKLLRRYVTEALNDQNILGLFLGGSRGKGCELEHLELPCLAEGLGEVYASWGAVYPWTKAYIPDSP